MYRQKIGLVLVVLAFGSVYPKGILAERKLLRNHSTSNLNIKNFLLTSTDEKTFRLIREKIIQKKWAEASTLCPTIHDEGYRKAINIYLQLKKFKATFSPTREEVVALMKFNRENYFLGEFENFNRRIEFYYLNDIINWNDVNSYFYRFPSRDINVRIKLLKDEEMAIMIGQQDQSKQPTILTSSLIKKIKNLWITGDFSSEEQDLLLENFHTKLDEKNFIDRAELLVFKKNMDSLEKLLPLLPDKNYKILFSTIMEIEEFPDFIDDLLAKIPKPLASNEALAFTKLKYYRLREMHDKAIEILLSLKGKRDYGQFWAIYRLIYARDSLRNKNYQQAYDLISSYNAPPEADPTEAFWLSGWIALRFLKKYDLAFKHFYGMYKNVSYPINLAKASYWLGKTMEDKGNSRDALYWYTIASAYPLTFYGQLASYARHNLLPPSEKTQEPFQLPKPPEFNEDNLRQLTSNGLVKYALLCHYYENRRDEAGRIFIELINNFLKTKEEIAALVYLVEGLDNERLLVSIAKQANHKLVFFVDYLFPQLLLVEKNKPDIALIHAIIKQESGFVRNIKGGAGDSGLMQIIPPTAKTLSKELGLTYSRQKLEEDPYYNIKLGSYYIRKLIDQFGGSKILAIAAYNAGPDMARRWKSEFWNNQAILNNTENTVDLIESIDYGTTRSYVQRVLENLIVYEHLFGTKP
jgi:soluble lytic murein transglycosylase